MHLLLQCTLPEETQILENLEKGYPKDTGSQAQTPHADAGSPIMEPTPQKDVQ